ncbi:MAG: hypothetical protein S0880_32650 [Actinomycetota bacterium]|nr:hypothetical protein [Actinomycetota bacterium]
MRRSLTAVLAVMALILAGCGGDDDSADGASCVDLAGEMMELLQDTIDVASDMTLEEMIASGEEDTPEFLVELETEGEALEERAEEIGCSDEEMEQLMCDRVDEIEAEGPFAEGIMASAAAEC